MRPSETWAARSYGSGCGGLNADAREQAEAVQQGRGTYALTLHHRYDTIAALINKDMASPTLMTA